MRRPWAPVALATGALFLVVMLGAGWWVHYASYVPVISPPPEEKPVANGWQDCDVAAGRLSLEAKSAEAALYRARPLRARDWSSATTPQLRRLTRMAAPALHRIREGMKHPLLGRLEPGGKYRPSPGVRVLSRLLMAESELALRDGYPDQALEAALVTTRMGALCTRGGGIDHGMVGIDAQRDGTAGIEKAREQVSAETAASAAQQLWELDALQEPLDQALRRDRDVMSLWLAERLRQGDLLSMVGEEGFEKQREALEFVLTPKRRIFYNYRHAQDLWIARAQLPWPQRDRSPALPRDVWNSSDSSNGRWQEGRWAGISARKRILAAALAARAFQLRQGRLPKSLGELVPAYLPAVPEDPFAPAPLVYRVVQGKPLIYSRGPDGDDDGGKRLLGPRSTVDADGDLGFPR